MNGLKKSLTIAAITLAGLGAGMGIGHAGQVQHPAGGTWEFGTDNGSIGTDNYSIYQHPERIHSSAVKNCNGTVRSGWANPGAAAYAKQRRCATGNEAFWNIKEPAQGGNAPIG